jgi:hypothetical protein
MYHNELVSSVSRQYAPFMYVREKSITVTETGGLHYGKTKRYELEAENTIGMS